MKTFFGKLCKHHPDKSGERSIAFRGCVWCNREKATANYKNNKEKVLASNAKWKAQNPEKKAAADAAWAANNRARSNAIKQAWRERNRDKDRAIGKRWREQNRDRSLANKLAWVKKNPERVSHLKAKRRGVEKKAMPAWANEFFILEAYALARLRTKMLGFPWHVDHIVPLQSDSVCGFHVEHNLQVIPGSVNQSKSNRTWPGMA